MEARSKSSEYSVEVEKLSSVERKVTIKVPAQVVRNRVDKGLVAVQKTANLKGFRAGHAPLSIIKQYYGEDVRHRVFHTLIDESLEETLQNQNLRAIGSPKIDTSTHQTGEGEHDHNLHEDEDFTFSATFEVIPEIEVKDYTQISVVKEEVQVTEEDVQKVVDQLHQSQAQLVPLSGGLILPDGSESSRVAQSGDFVDIQFSGSLLTPAGKEAKKELGGTRVIEIGSGALIPGFEEQLAGMHRGETKTFTLTFPGDFGDLSGKDVEFTVTVQEIKEKKLPPLDEEMVKQLGHESLEKLREKVREYLLRERTQESQDKMEGQVISKLIETNPFDVPRILIESQTKVLVDGLAKDLKKQGYDQKAIQEIVYQELEQLKKRAEGQVRATLVLESVCQQEKIAITPDELHAEIDELAESMEMTRSDLDDFYSKNPAKKGEVEFRLRQERAMKFLLDKAEVTSK